MAEGNAGLSGNEHLLPQEEVLALDTPHKKLTIGVPAEQSYQECRIPLVPQAVGLLVADGHDVIIEHNAGKQARFPDSQYSDAGARIVYDHEEVFKADLICKIAPVTLEEAGLLTRNQTIVSALHLSSIKRSWFEALMARKVTLLGFEYIQDKSGTFPVIRAMSELVGTAAVFIASQYLSDPELGKGTLLGGFPGIFPTEVVILGAGTVAEYAARAAIGCGSVVRVFDNSIYKLRRLQHILGNRIHTSTLQPDILTPALERADVAIGAIHADEGMSPCVVTSQMVERMKEGALIIDVSIDQGGCFETSQTTSHKDPVFVHHGVIHYCVPNIASRFPHTASHAISNYFTPVLRQIGEIGGVDKILRFDNGLRKGAVLFNGILTKSYIGNRFNLPSQDIDLLIASFS